MSSAVPTKVTFSLGEFRRHGCDTGIHCDGWGLACFDGFKAEIFKEPEAAALSEKMASLMKNHPPSSLVISHIRKATQGKRSHNNTQPFFMDLNGHRHVFVHNGDLIDIQNKITISKYLPKGETDSEYAFCYLMEQITRVWERAVPTLEERIETISKVFDLFATLGPANFIYYDGEYLFAFANKRTQKNGKIEPPGLHYLERSSVKGKTIPDIPGIEIEESQHQMVLFASVPLTKENWQPFEVNQLIVVQSGKILYSSAT